MNELKLAYTMGALDGDGQITYKYYIGKKGNMVEPVIHLTSSTNYVYLCQLQQALDFETTIAKSSGIRNPLKHKQGWVLCLSYRHRENLFKFIDLAMPFLRMKAERLDRLRQAILGINVEKNLKKITELNDNHGKGTKKGHIKKYKHTKKVKKKLITLDNFGIK